MSLNAIGFNYATALIDCFKSPDQVRSGRRDLDAFGRLVEDLPSLSRVLDHPAFPLERRLKILDEVLEKIEPQATVRRFLHLVVEKQRAAAVPEIVVAFGQLADARENVTHAEVVTAVELGVSARTAWEKSLARLTGRKVHITYRTDSSLVGGALTRVGSRIYDGSVRKHLERIRSTLLEETTETRS